MLVIWPDTGTSIVEDEAFPALHATSNVETIPSGLSQSAVIEVGVESLGPRITGFGTEEME